MHFAQYLQKAFGPFEQIRTRVGPIGLECSSEALHLAQLGRIHEHIVLRAKASLEYPTSLEDILNSPADFKALIQHAFKKQPFRGRSVISVMPESKICIAPMTYQVPSGETDLSVILKLLQERTKDDILDYSVDYIPLKTAGGNQKLSLMAASRKETIIQYLELLREAGLKVKALEIVPLAIRRLVSFVDVLRQSPIKLVINFGSTVSYTTVISGTELIFDEELKFGEETVLKQLSAVLNMPVDSIRHFLCHQIGLNNHSLWAKQAGSSETSEIEMELAATITEIVKPSFSQLVVPIQRTIEYISSLSLGSSLERIYVIGSIARWRGIERYLTELFNLPVAVIPNLDWFSFDKKNEGEKTPEIAVAIGLALRGLVNHV